MLVLNHIIIRACPTAHQSSPSAFLQGFSSAYVRGGDSWARHRGDEHETDRRGVDVCDGLAPGTAGRGEDGGVAMSRYTRALPGHGTALGIDSSTSPAGSVDNVGVGTGAVTGETPSRLPPAEPVLDPVDDLVRQLSALGLVDEEGPVNTAADQAP